MCIRPRLNQFLMSLNGNQAVKYVLLMVLDGRAMSTVANKLRAQTCGRFLIDCQTGNVLGDLDPVMHVALAMKI